MASVGFSTGCLYKSGIAFDERVRLYHSLGADALELAFSTPEELFDYNLTESLINDIKKFSFVSIHSPWKNIRYGSNSDSRKVIEKLNSLITKIPIHGLVVHPDIIDDFRMLDQSGLPFLIENMDSRKSYGTQVEQLSILKNKYRFGFVLDLQHSYEHDSSMQLAKDLIEVLGNRLNHMHVSGSTELETHSSVYCAENKDAISKILQLGINVPKILEGVLSEEIKNSINHEIEYVRNFEKTASTIGIKSNRQ